ncbi:MAG: hypothetical protein WCQ77_15370 [Planctomycetota bacterium]
MISARLQRSSCPLPKVPKKTVVAGVPVVLVVRIGTSPSCRTVRPFRPARLRWASTLGVAVAALVAAWCDRLPADETPYVQDERSYAVFDALFLQRNNATVNRPIVVSRTATSAPEILAGDLQSTIGGGARFLYGN